MTHHIPRQLPAEQARCRPSGPCAIRSSCARFLSTLPASGAVLMDGYAEAQTMAPIPIIAACRKYLSQSSLDAHRPEPEKKAKPWVGGAL